MRKAEITKSNYWKLYAWLTYKGLPQRVSDEKHIKWMWKSYFGPSKLLNLKSPITFNEKLQWLKLHDRNPLYNTLVDKYRVKPWVAERIGSEYVTETYAVWESVNDVDISGLPGRFVLKTNHDCGGVVVCSDRRKFDLEAAKKKLAKHLRTNYYWGGREWPYEDVKPLVFAEEYIEPEDPGEGLVDYKFFCFGGKADCVMACVGRASGKPRFYFLDRGWEVRRYNASSLSLPEGFSLPRPDGADGMFEIAERLSEGIPFVRVDLYDAGGRVLFGEMTLYPQSGFDPNILPEADERWGKMIDLDTVKAERFGG